MKNNENKHRITQLKRLYDYLFVYGHINPLVAWQQLGIYRLSDVIFRLKKKPYFMKIRTDRIEVYNRFNEPCCVANYVVEKEIPIVETKPIQKEETAITESKQGNFNLF